MTLFSIKIFVCSKLSAILENLKSNKFSKIADNLKPTKTSIEKNIKMFTLAEGESKRLLARNKYSELDKCKANFETRMETLQDLKY